MRTKVREFPCHDEAGNDAVVIEWSIQADGIRNKHACCKEFSLADGSPVAPLGGKFEHFYSGKLFIPN
ncbi:hypothetical protein [Roseinatronobacter alkalisoli]|uniref:Uncharacterized protein n=1 Tax=Roseinatronobacter alkalisoli TaxID=3028235 RepID=A0ABT5T7Y3_9RHOB|nr:hypothetical protein [Roseinatronobacter sp. HJB301]MDD7970805.1 hypothetical protein [Roseinatronobacter sp. HJB301]